MLDRTEYENYWYAFQQKLDKILAERKMSYRRLSIELGKSPGYIYDIVNRRIDPSVISPLIRSFNFQCAVISLIAKRHKPKKACVVYEKIFYIKF